MSDDNVMYDTPLDVMNELAQRSGECVAQSVIPTEDGTYRCACTCERWEVYAPDREEGLRMARLHTRSAAT